MQGFLDKMGAKHTSGDQPVDYYLLDQHLNPLIGHRITLDFTGTIRCQACGADTRKSYSQGYCYDCFKTLARCDLCVVSPERCHFDDGTCREPDWGESFCMQPHLVYIANSSGIKVGITRPDNVPTRWIDQGAVQAVPALSVDTRQIAGFAEVAFKSVVSDKTHWQQMLKAEDRHIDIETVRDDLVGRITESLTTLRQRFGERAIQPVITPPTTIRYPVDRYPTRVVAVSFDKTARIEGVLTGIKGQYLLLDTGVLNVRRFNGYEVEFHIGERVAARGAGETLSLF